MKKLIVIGGATASGKTSLAIELALHFNTEIISADSRQCYRELNIGVAKPNLRELESVTHHFINSHSIHDEINAGDYERFALESLKKIFQKNEIAICVGGTGLYIKALCEGIDEMPQINHDINQQINEEFNEKGIAWLQNEIENIDPLFFQHGEINNPTRMLRALVFKLSCGKSILEFRNHTPKVRDFDIEKYVIDIPRNILYERINNRVDVMIKDGLIEEVKSLIEFNKLKNLQTVGYSEILKYFNNESSQQEAIDKIKQHSRNYAKRQITWFKNQPNFQRIQNVGEIIKNQ